LGLGQSGQLYLFNHMITLPVITLSGFHCSFKLN
jgi:hypothetical protein